MNFAIGRITVIGTDAAAGNYIVIADGGATDGVTNFSVNGLTQIPFSLSEKKANKEIRTQFAALILAQSGLVIDPSDIYFPAP